jgi:hypothetical protein
MDLIDSKRANKAILAIKNAIFYLLLQKRKEKKEIDLKRILTQAVEKTRQKNEARR